MKLYIVQTCLCFLLSQETRLNFMLKLQEISRYSSCGSNLYRATDHMLYWFVGYTWKNNSKWCRGQLKCDGTRAETRFRLSAKRTSPIKSAGVSVQSTADSRRVRISGNNAGYTVFRGSVKGLPTPFAIFPFISSPTCNHVPSHFNWTLPNCLSYCEIFVAYTQLTNVVAGHIVQVGRP